MLTKAQAVLSSLVAILGFSLFGPTAAHAELNACGNIFLAASSACSYKPKTECMTQCMTVAVEESCVSQIYDSCESSCTTTATTDCESTCMTSCVEDCTTTATTSNAPSCMDLCVADCNGGGDDSCGSAAHPSPCNRCQKHNCDKRCEEKCGDDPKPTKVTTVTDCTPTCTNACSASCTAKVNTQCQEDCQENTYTQCEQTMVQHCNTECKDKGGAIFCDGQFVNADDSKSCADELDADLSIHVDISASANVVATTTSNVGKKASNACTVANVGAGGGQSALASLGAMTVLGFWFAKRRRAR